MLNTSAVPLDRRRQDARRSIGQGTHGDHHDLWIDPDDSAARRRSATTAAARSPTTSRRAQRELERAGLSDRAVLPRDHDRARAVPRLRRAAGQQHAVRAEQHERGAAAAAAAAMPPVAPYQVGGGEPGYIAPDPTDPDVFFAGTNNGSFLTRFNRRTGELREVGAVSALLLRRAVESDVKERWQWTYPIIFSPRRSERALHHRRSASGRRPTAATPGTAISGDLTRHDPKTMQESGGPITHDMNSPEIYATVFSLGARQEGRQRHLGRIGRRPRARDARRRQDAGRTSRRRTCPTSAASARSTRSAFDDGTAYVAVKKLLLGDSVAVHLPHARLRQDVDEDRQRHRRRTTTCTPCARIRRAGACSTPARSTASTSRSTTASTGCRFAERPARHAGHRHLGRGQRARDRHARPQLLRARRHRAAAAVRRAGDERDRRRICSSRATRCDRRRRRAITLLAEEAGAEADARDPRRQGPGGADVRRRAACGWTRRRGGQGRRGRCGGAGARAVQRCRGAARRDAAARPPRRPSPTNEEGGGRGRGGPPTASMAAGRQPLHVGPAVRRR